MQDETGHGVGARLIRKEDDRYLRGRVNRLVVLIEKESIQLVDALTRGEGEALHEARP